MATSKFIIVYVVPAMVLESTQLVLCSLPNKTAVIQGQLGAMPWS